LRGRKPTDSVANLTTKKGRTLYSRVLHIFAECGDPKQISRKLSCCGDPLLHSREPRATLRPPLLAQHVVDPLHPPLRMNPPSRSAPLHSRYMRVAGRPWGGSPPASQLMSPTITTTAHHPHGSIHNTHSQNRPQSPEPEPKTYSSLSHPRPSRGPCCTPRKRTKGAEHSPVRRTIEKISTKTLSSRNNLHCPQVRKDRVTGKQVRESDINTDSFKKWEASDVPLYVLPPITGPAPLSHSPVVVRTQSTIFSSAGGKLQFDSPPCIFR